MVALTINAENSSFFNDNDLSNSTLDKYIRNVSAMSKSTAYEYYGRLNNFAYFISKKYDLGIDILINKIKEGYQDPYDILTNFVLHLRETSDIAPLTLKQRVVTAKNFLEYHDIDISPRKFKLKVKLPKVVKKDKEALSKQDVIEILNACNGIRLRTYVMFLASTGMRAVEALSVRICDVDFDAEPVKIFVRGEYTKTKVDRFVYLTNEAAMQLKDWLQYKYRTRRVSHKDEEKFNTITEYKTPTKNDTDLIFSVRQTENPEWLYNYLDMEFGKTLDRIGKGYSSTRRGSRSLYDKRRQITFHSFRRFVKTTISDLGYQDYSEWFISHSGSSYWRKNESEKAEIFKKIEPYLIFLDFGLERKGADVQTKLQEKDKQIEGLIKKQEHLEQLIQSLIDSGQLKPSIKS